MKKSELYGFTGTAIAAIIVLLLLWLIVLPGLPSPEEEGIMVSFGNATDGGGNSAIAQPASQPEVTTPTKTVTRSTKDDVITQKDNSAVLADQKKKKEAEANKKAQEEKNKKIAEQKKKEQNAINNANSTMSGLFGNNNGSGTGNTSGNAQQGNPLGSGTSGGNSWSLNGRSLNGKLVSPSYDNDVEGKVTVNIRVDENGHVISASVGSPTTISDSATRNAALTAAKSTRFTSGGSIAAGTITYNFKLK